MGEVAALFRPWQNNTTSLIMSMQYTGGAHFSINGMRWRSKPKKQQQCHLLLMRRRKRKSCSCFESKAMMVTPPSTYSSIIATDNPLSESPSASFDSYLDNKPRVFRAIFPHQQRTKRLNEIRWDLQGIDEIIKPSHFSLGVDGALYQDRNGKESRLRGQLHIRMSFVHPPVLDFVPEDIRRHVAESVLKRLMENLKDGMNGSLLADYSEFKREKSRLRKAL